MEIRISSQAGLSAEEAHVHDFIKGLVGSYFEIKILHQEGDKSHIGWINGTLTLDWLNNFDSVKVDNFFHRMEALSKNHFHVYLLKTPIEVLGSLSCHLQKAKIFINGVVKELVGIVYQNIITINIPEGFDVFDITNQKTLKVLSLRLLCRCLGVPTPLRGISGMCIAITCLLRLPGKDFSWHNLYKLEDSQLCRWCKSELEELIKQKTKS